MTLTPKYQIGQTIYQAYTESEQREHDCPDCLGAKVWDIESPAGERHTVKCPRCGGGFYGLNFDDKIPSLRYRHYVPVVRELKITGYCVNEYNSGKVKYSSATSNNSSYTFDEDKIITDRQVASNIAQLLAAEANEKEAATIEHMRGLAFANLTLEDARLEVFRSQLWNAHYHLGNIMGELRDLLDQNEGASEETLREKITDHIRWNTDYHFKAMPLAPLLKAVSAMLEEREEPASWGALEKAYFDLPEQVRIIVSEELTEAAKKRIGY